MTPTERKFSYKVVAAVVAVHLVGWAGMVLMGWDDQVHGSTATTDECDRTIGAYVPAVSSAVETGDDTPTDVGFVPDAAGVGGGQGPVTASAAEPVSAPTIHQLVALPEVRS